MISGEVFISPYFLEWEKDFNRANVSYGYSRLRLYGCIIFRVAGRYPGGHL